LEFSQKSEIFIPYKSNLLYRVKTIEQIKARSLQNINIDTGSLDRVQNDQGSQQSNTLEAFGTTQNQITQFGSNGSKTHSVTTPKSDKMSNFGKTHQRQKSMKSK